MGRRAVIRFFTLKWLKFQNMRAEPELVYGREPLDQR
jgi:hypothetical protein